MLLPLLRAAAPACFGLLLVAPRANAQEMHAVPLEDTAETSANASLGDLDGDGDLDIVLAKGRHWPLKDWVLLNDGAGGFAERHALPGSADNTYTAALADLDGDGDLDLVVGNDRPDDKRIYFNDGTGSFTLAGTFGDASWPTRNVTVADLNGDARPEIVVANRGGPENRSANYVCVNDGSGAFPDCSVLSRNSATTIGAADLTGDGFTDLVVPHRDGGQSYLYVNDGSGGFSGGPRGRSSRVRDPGGGLRRPERRRDARPRAGRPARGRSVAPPRPGRHLFRAAPARPGNQPTTPTRWRSPTSTGTGTRTW